MEFHVKKTSTVNKLVIGSGITVLILIGSILYSYKASSDLYDNFSVVQHTHKVTYNLESILLQLTENEAAARGYIITGNEDFIKELNKGNSLMNKEIADLEILLKNNPVQQIRVKELKSLIAKRREIIYLTIDLKNGGEKDTQLLISKVGEGKIYKDNLRSLKDVMEKEQELFLINRQNEAYINLRNTNFTLAAAAIISCLVAVLKFYIIRRDIDQRNKLEEELLELNINKNKFFSIISHDLRGPVHGILKLASFLKDENNTSKQDALVMGGIIENSAKKLSNLLENLLKWAKVQMKTIEMRPEVFRLSELADECINALEPTAEIKNIKLLNLIDTNVQVKADRNMIDTVIRNLLSNSIKFCNEGGHVVINSENRESQIVVSVEDNGIGMDEETLYKLFRLDEAYSSKGTANEIGSGLGLILSKEFIEVNHGSIVAESKINEGSKFTFTLPA